MFGDGFFYHQVTFAISFWLKVIAMGLFVQHYHSHLPKYLQWVTKYKKKIHANTRQPTIFIFFLRCKEAAVEFLLILHVYLQTDSNG